MKAHAKNPEVGVKNVRIQDSFWSSYQQLVQNTVLPYQWRALNDRIPGAEKSHAIANFKIAAGLQSGDFYGYIFQDSDVAKYLETVAYSLSLRSNPKLEETADKLIDLLGKAQQPDGYLDTYFIIKEPIKRWTNLREAHELYCAGHLIEAAVAYQAATGKRKILDIACRWADLIDNTFGRGVGRIRGYCGHPEIELALVRLYEATGVERYLSLARYFVEERGCQPDYFAMEAKRPDAWSAWAAGDGYDPKYFQCDKTVRDQTEAKGHAVRVMYLYSAVADLARMLNDRGLKRACGRIWDDITNRKMYVTGGIGSTAQGEAFTGPYDLPNDTMYTETCAAIGLVMFAHRMLKMDADVRYADVMEKALFNGALGGISLDGTKYFYVNPLEVRPDTCEHNPSFKHVKPARQSWFGCACCPPNIARLITSIGKYAYTQSGRVVYVHLFLGNQTRLNVDGREVDLKEETDYPYAGQVKLTVGIAEKTDFTLSLRVPAWCRKFSLRVNGKRVKGTMLKKGYLPLRRSWKNGDTIELNLEMPVIRVRANSKLPHDAGKVALQRGPLVYCFEEADNGKDLHDLRIPKTTKWSFHHESKLLGGTIVLSGKALRSVEKRCEKKALYSTQTPTFKKVTARAVPYSLWGNRKTGEMRVWLNEI